MPEGHTLRRLADDLSAAFAGRVTRVGSPQGRFAAEAAVLDGTEVVVADSAGTWPMLDDVTSDLVYVRLHGEEELYASGYTDSALEKWADRLRGWTADGREAFVYFDNDMKGYAPHDARKLIAKLDERAT